MHLRRSRSAAGMVEYSLIAALVALALIVILALVGTSVTNVFQQVINGLTGNTPTPPTSLVVNITNLDITVPGDIPGAIPSVNVNGPAGYSQHLTSSTTLTNLTAGSYTVTADPVVGTLAQFPGNPVTFFPMITPASVGLPSSSHIITVDYSNAVPASTHGITGTNLALVTSYTVNNPNSETIVFSALPQDFVMVQGDTLIAGVSTAVPNGFLVKVSSINGTTVHTIPATYADAFARADFTGTADTAHTFTTPLLTALGKGPVDASVHSGAWGIGCGTNTNINFTGGDGVTFHTTFTLRLAWPFQDQSGDQFGFTITETDNWNFTADSPGNLAIFCNVIFPAQDNILAAYPLTVPVPFPIIITPELALIATLDLNWTPAAHPILSIQGISSGTFGFLCDRTGCHNRSTPPTNATATANLSGVGALKIEFGPRIAIKIDDFAGPYFAIFYYDKFVQITNASPTCFNDEIGLSPSIGFTIGVGGIPNPFSNLWNFQLAAADVPLACMAPINPTFAASDPSFISTSSAIDNRGCIAHDGFLAQDCVSTDGYNTHGNALGPGQIQFNPDNAQPRGTVEGSIYADLPFSNIPPGLVFPPNTNNSCNTDPEPNGPGTGSFCGFNLLGPGRTWTFINGGQIGRWSVTDANGYVYLPPTDTVLFGATNGYTDGGPGCGGNECVDGMQFGSFCKTAAGVKESCFGHTLHIQIWIESNGKRDYAGSGSQNYPVQIMSWFDGILASIGGNSPNGGPIIAHSISNAGSGAWHCSPNNSIYNQPCP